MSKNETAWTEVIKVNHDNPQPPVRCCLICDRYEKPVEGIVVATLPWFCPRCKEKLKNFVESEN